MPARLRPTGCRRNLSSAKNAAAVPRGRFGSRARGDYRRTSDIDLAVVGGDFARFALDVDEETSTLLEYDIVDMSREMQDELRQSIMREGKILYEKV